MRAVDAIRDWWRTNARIRHGQPPGAPPTSASPRGWAGLALGMTAIAASGGLGFAASQWASRTPPASRVEAEPAHASPGSLYQYLEDNGYHLPE